MPLDRADAHRTTGGLVQAGLSIEGMCFKEFLSLREGLRFLKRTIGEASLIRLLEDGKQGYKELLALTTVHFPEVFVEGPDFHHCTLCLMSEWEADRQEHNEPIPKKVYLSEENKEYAFWNVDGSMRRGAIPPYLDLSHLSLKLEETDFKKNVVGFLIEKEHAARSAFFRQAFDSICEKIALEACFEEIQRAHTPQLPESTRALIFRELYESIYKKWGHNLSFLQALLALTPRHPELMAGQNIVSTVERLALLPNLFKLFPKKAAAEALEAIERVLMDYLDKEAASALWVGLLLSLPQDAKLDNFRLQLSYDKEENLQRCRIVSIDSDMSLEMPFMQVFRKKSDTTPKLGLTIKNSLYWLAELLEQPIATPVRTRLLSSSARSQWLTWLCLVARRNQEHSVWQQQGVLSLNEAARLLVRLPERVLKFMLAQWEKLQTLLLTNPEMTHGALLSALYPTVLAAYDAIVQETRAKKKEPTLCDIDALFCESFSNRRK